MFATLSKLVVNIIYYLYDTQIEQPTHHMQSTQATQSKQPIYSIYRQTENFIHMNEKDLFENLEPDDIENPKLDNIENLELDNIKNLELDNIKNLELDNIKNLELDNIENVSINIFLENQTFEQKELIRKESVYKQKEPVRPGPYKIKLNHNNNNRNMLFKEHMCCLCKKIIDMSPYIFCVNDNIYCSNYICAQIYREKVAQIFK
jgi:hypothetical protein